MSRYLGLPHIELDRLYHGPNWKPATAEELRGRVAEELSLTDDWVFDGNYVTVAARSRIDDSPKLRWANSTRGWRRTPVFWEKLVDFAGWRGVELG